MRTPLWNLICLRYRLLWSRMCTSRGRAILAILGYAVCLAAWRLHATGGFVLASLAASIERSREVATVVLARGEWAIAVGGRSFPSLEELYLHLVGSPDRRMAWL